MTNSRNGLDLEKKKDAPVHLHDGSIHHASRMSSMEELNSITSIHSYRHSTFTASQSTFVSQEARTISPPESTVYGSEPISQRQHAGLLPLHWSSRVRNHLTPVEWEDDDDPENPQNWSIGYRWYLTGLAALLVLNSIFSSSSPSGIMAQMRETFNFGSEVATLTIAIFLAGYCGGPFLWGPLSERVGRRPVFLVALLAYTGFNIGCALAPNTASLLVFRFLAGFFAASPLTNSGGVIVDIFDAKQRGVAMSIFSIAPFAGPAIGPIVSGAITISNVDWRWLFWVSSIFSGICLILTIFTFKETYAPVILVNKAKRLRKETKDKRHVARLELAPIELKSLLHDTLARPFIMLVQEPILAALTVYISFVYGVLYLLFEAFPVVFEELHGFNELQNGLAFVPFFLGGCAAVLIYALCINPRYVLKVEASKDGRVPPEERLYIVMIAGPVLVAAFFWFAWTSISDINFWAPLMAGSLLGFGTLFCFLGILNYIMDVYLTSAASALAANTVCRSTAGAAFPLFASQLYATLSPVWASSFLGFVTLVLAPMPFLFYKWGPQIRKLSKHAGGQEFPSSPEESVSGSV